MGPGSTPEVHSSFLPCRSEDMLELVAEVRIGDRDPIPLLVPSLLPRLRGWRTVKTGMWVPGGAGQVASELCRSQLLLVVIVAMMEGSFRWSIQCFFL